jgi:intraflagellar transport protein 172
LPDVYLKHALLLEDDEKCDKAEEEFLKAGKPKEAIDMYLHQHDWENAIRVAESFDSSSVSAVFLAHAAVCAESKDLSKAEELFLAASRPDLALSMYQDADLLPEAIRIAQIYLPHRAAELNAAYNSTQARAGKTTVKTDFMVIGRSMEQSTQWAQALEVYLSAKAGKVDPSINIEEIWDRAVEIARKYVTNRYVEVGIEISRRLVDIKKEESAADLLFEVGRQDDAINLCIQARKFEKAKSLAKGISVLKRKVDEAYQGFLITREDTKELVELGHSEDALNVLAKRGDWDRLWQMAVKGTVSQATLSKYVLMRVEELISSPKPNALDEAVQVLNRQLAPANEQAVTVYRQLVTRLFSRSNKNEGPEYISTFSTLRDVLFNVANKVRTSDKKLQNELLHLLMAVHYQSVLFSARRLGLKEIAAKCAVTMLKYPEYIPADKAYYQAGNLCCELGGSYINLAFMLLNRYFLYYLFYAVYFRDFVLCATDTSILQKPSIQPIIQCLIVLSFLKPMQFLLLIFFLSTIIYQKRMIVKKLGHGFCR